MQQQLSRSRSLFPCFFCIYRCYTPVLLKNLEKIDKIQKLKQVNTPKSAQYFWMHNFLSGIPNNAILEPKLKRISRATTYQFSILSNSAISGSEIVMQVHLCNQEVNWLQNSNHCIHFADDLRQIFVRAHIGFTRASTEPQPSSISDLTQKPSIITQE
ncbi:hypothetical protein LguiA_025979 [Lonicera macranthoides]